MGYTKHAIRGVSWIMLLRLLTRGLTFVRLAILGRLLTPTQFGYFGIASLLLAFLEIFTETGINVFLVQRKEKISEFINAAWFISLIRGLILSLLILVSAPQIANFFNSPGAYPSIALISVVPLIRGFINPAIVIYQKELQFNKEFRLRSILFAVDVFTSTLIGVITRSAESLIYGLIAASLLEVILSYTLFPISPRLKFEIDKIKLVFHRGKWITISGIFSYLADNGDNFAVAKLLGSSSLGIYQIAYKFSTLPISEVTNVVNQVIFPVYSKFSDDKKRLWKAFKKVTFFNTIAAFSLGVIIIVFAEQLIKIVVGDQWLSAVPIIQILSFYGILRTTFGSFSALFLSVNKQDYAAKMLFFRVTALLISIVPLIYLFGMIGAAYSMIFSVLMEIPVILFFTFKVFRKQ